MHLQIAADQAAIQRAGAEEQLSVLQKAIQEETDAATMARAEVQKLKDNLAVSSSALARTEAELRASRAKNDQLATKVCVQWAGVHG